MSTLWLRSARAARPCSSRSFFNSSRARSPVGTSPASSTITSIPASVSLPSFRDQLARTTDPTPAHVSFPRPRIRNQVLFAVFGSWLAFTWAAVETNRDTEDWSTRLIEANPFAMGYSPSSADMRKARYLELGKELQASLSTLKDTVSAFPKTIQVGIVYSYAKAAQYFLDNTENRRTCWALGATMTAVCAAWLVPRWGPGMMRRFTHDPLSGKSYTLLTSTFSHKSIIHLGFNCMALASFGSSAMVYLMKAQEQNPFEMPESTPGYHFAAFFISAGLFSGLASHVISARVRFPRIVARLMENKLPEAAKPSTLSRVLRARPATIEADAAPTVDRSMKILPSLGASGAIYASVSLTALAFPDAVISLIFPPTHPIPIQWGVGGLVLLDVVGLLRGWSLFDHAAHLAGAGFGVFYYYYGPALWDFMRALDAEMVEEGDEYQDGFGGSDGAQGSESVEG